MLRTGLCVIIDPDAILGRPIVAVAEEALAGGAGMIQLRDKRATTRQLVARALELKPLCTAAGAALIINDRADVALAAEADGAHLGQDDLPAEIARRILGTRAIIGCSARTVELAMAAEQAGADYLGVGAMFATNSKDDTIVVGPKRIEEVKAHVRIPVVAIGGITSANVVGMIQAGADAVAVIGAVVSAQDIRQATAELSTRIREART
ncbi:MAG: thiamine phosphate synthase [Chloroflexi bacterium]|nr:thiamine phosphate synthase [Chloroflexota bacterium]